MQLKFEFKGVVMTTAQESAWKAFEALQLALSNLETLERDEIVIECDPD